MGIRLKSALEIAQLVDPFFIRAAIAGGRSIIFSRYLPAYSLSYKIA